MKKLFALLLAMVSAFAPLFAFAEDDLIDPETVHAYFAEASTDDLLNAQKYIEIELEYRGYFGNEAAPASVASAEIDLSGMNYNELVSLKDKTNIAIWNSEEWQEVKVPQGVWKIGEDIPQGHWTITASPSSWVSVTYGSELRDNQKEIRFFCDGYYQEHLTGEDYFLADEDDVRSIDIDAKDGYYIEIDGGSVVFTPYSGKPSLDFK